VTTKPSAGMHRITWDLRYPPTSPVALGESESDWGHGPEGPMAAPGTYTVTLSKRVRGVESPLAGPRSFEAVSLGTATLPATDREALLAFQRQVADLRRAAQGALRAADEAKERLDYLREGLMETPGADAALRDRTADLARRLQDLRIELEGDQTVSRHQEPTPPAIMGRIWYIIEGLWSSTSAPTRTMREDYAVAAEAFPPVLARLRGLIETDLASLERDAEAAGVPWTPGRVPSWPR